MPKKGENEMQVQSRQQFIYQLAERETDVRIIKEKSGYQTQYQNKRLLGRIVVISETYTKTCHSSI